jgi:hypothetical protein
MSQYGSLGWALYQGKTWRQILNFYYRNGVNTLSRLSPSDDFVLPWGLMSVRLFEDYDATDKDRLQTAVVSDTGTLSVAGLNNPQTWSTIVVREKTGQTNVWEIWGSKIKKCTTSYTNLAGDTDFQLLAANFAPGGLVNGKYPKVSITTPKWADPNASVPRDLIGVCDPRDNGGAGQVVYYRGMIEAANGTTGENRTVNASPPPTGEGSETARACTLYVPNLLRHAATQLQTIGIPMPRPATLRTARCTWVPRGARVPVIPIR